MTIPKNIVEAMRAKKGSEFKFLFEKGDVVMKLVD